MEELDQFIGTDIWVKARVKINNRFFYSFIRVLSKGVETHTSPHSSATWDTVVYTINEISVTRISKNGECHCSPQFAEYTLKTKYNLGEYEIKVLKPLEIITTEELFISVE